VLVWWYCCCFLFYVCICLCGCILVCEWLTVGERERKWGRTIVCVVICGCGCVWCCGQLFDFYRVALRAGDNRCMASQHSALCACIFDVFDSFVVFEKMLVPKKTRQTIYQQLFKDGVITAKKVFSGKHNDVDVPNLYVIKLMLSLKSRSLVKETFNWQWHYFYLTNEGIEYLRGYLNLPEEIVPATLKKPKGAAGPAGGARYGDRADRPPRAEGDRPPRRDFQGENRDDKKIGAGGDFKPEFRGEGGGRGGFGRGGRGDGAGREPREGNYRREGAPAGVGRGRGAAPQ